MCSVYACQSIHAQTVQTFVVHHNSHQSSLAYPSPTLQNIAVRRSHGHRQVSWECMAGSARPRGFSLPAVHVQAAPGCTSSASSFFPTSFQLRQGQARTARNTWNPAWPAVSHKRAWNLNPSRDNWGGWGGMTSIASARPGAPAPKRATSSVHEP